MGLALIEYGADLFTINYNSELTAFMDQILDLGIGTLCSLKDDSKAKISFHHVLLFNCCYYYVVYSRYESLINSNYIPKKKEKHAKEGRISSKRNPEKIT